MLVGVIVFMTVLNLFWGWGSSLFVLLEGIIGTRCIGMVKTGVASCTTFINRFINRGLLVSIFVACFFITAFKTEHWKRIKDYQSRSCDQKDQIDRVHERGTKFHRQKVSKSQAERDQVEYNIEYFPHIIASKGEILFWVRIVRLNVSVVTITRQIVPMFEPGLLMLTLWYVVIVFACRINNRWRSLKLCPPLLLTRSLILLVTA